MAKQQYGDQNGRNGSRGGNDKAAKLAAIRSGTGLQPDWLRINMELMHAVIGVATKDDGAIRFGYSRDGGAYSVALYMGGTPDTSYYHSDEEVSDYLQKVWEALRNE